MRKRKEEKEKRARESGREEGAKERIALDMPILSSFSEVTGGRLQSRVLLAYVQSKTDSQENRVALGNNSLGHYNGV